MSSTAPQTVRRRKVFYLPGYDPFPPRRYRELYRTEAAQQAAISGYDIALTGPMRGDGFGWQVTATIDGHDIDTEIEVLSWSDIAKDSYKGSVWKTYVGLFQTARIYFATGAFWRIIRLRKGPVIAALYPVFTLLAQAALAALLGFGASALLAHAQDLVATNAVWSTVVLVVRVLLFAIVFGFVLRWFRNHDGRFLAYYLMHDFAHSAKDYGAYSDALEHRLAAFKTRVHAALNSGVDEVLVVGHSSGAHLAISMLSDLIRTQKIDAHGPALSLLSLGHVVPMVSFLPHAERLRGDLRYLSTRAEVTWVDVTAPGDGCCFALCDPVAVSGQNTDDKQHPLVLSAAFTQSLSPARWRALRWRFFRLHFQYLCAFDQPRDYDYFQITAGPWRLAERYAGRQPSPSSVETSVSRYTSVRP